MKKNRVISFLIIMLLCSIIEVYALENPDQENKRVKKTVETNRDNKRIKIEIADEPFMIIGGMKMTLGQAIERALTQNYDVLTVGYEAAMIDTNYKEFRRKFDPVLSAEAGGNYVVFPPVLYQLKGIDMEGVNTGVTIYKKFESGTTLAAGLENDWRNIKIKDGLKKGMADMLTPSSANSPGLFVSIQQELLNNAFGINDRTMDRIMKNAMTMQKEAIKFQLSLIVVGVIGEYWTVVMDKVAMENAELQVEETRKVRDIAARNMQYGLSTDYTLNMYDAMLAGARAKFPLSRQKYSESRRRFLTTINFDSNMAVSDAAVFTDRLPDINVEEGMKTAFEKRADYRNALLSLENAKMGSKISSNSMLPSLVAEFNMKSSGENRNFGESYGEVGLFQYPAIQGKLKMTYPFGDAALYTQDRNARFRLKQAEIQLEKNKCQVKDDVLNSSEKIETLYTTYKNAMEARKKSELFYQGMLRDLRMGRLSSSIVKNGLDALVQSREGELQALIGYNVSLLQYDVVRNILFEKYNINVEKYIPRDKKK
jgi:hypothetical protein